MSIYGEAGVRAKQLILESGISPADAWEVAVTRMATSSASRVKSCPKAAFIGLCEAGLIPGISARDASRMRNKNAEYALAAGDLLQAEPHPGDAKDTLWNRATTAVARPARKHDGQMDVVLSLWRESLAP